MIGIEKAIFKVLPYMVLLGIRNLGIIFKNFQKVFGWFLIIPLKFEYLGSKFAAIL